MKFALKIALMFLLISFTSFSEEGETQKSRLGLSPMFLISLFSNSEDNENNFFYGSAYLAVSEKKKETLLGVGIKTNGTFELTLQKRMYMKRNATGLFAGLYSSVGFYTAKTYIDSENGMTISNSEGENFYSYGIRLGGNLGYRIAITDDFSITPKLGLVVPILGITGSMDYDNSEMRELLVLNNLMKMFDIGLHLETAF